MQSTLHTVLIYLHHKIIEADAISSIEAANLGLFLSILPSSRTTFPTNGIFTETFTAK